MKTRILLSSLAVALTGLGSTASADNSPLQTQLALARSRNAEATVYCPPTPTCPAPCIKPASGKVQAKTDLCPPCPVCPEGIRAGQGKRVSKCPPTPACPRC